MNPEIASRVAEKLKQGDVRVECELRDDACWNVENVPPFTQPLLYLEQGFRFVLWLPQLHSWNPPEPDYVTRAREKVVEYLLQLAYQLLTFKPGAFHELAWRAEEFAVNLNRVYDGEPVIAAKYHDGHFTVIIYIAPTGSPVSS